MFCFDNASIQRLTSEKERGKEKRYLSVFLMSSALGEAFKRIISLSRSVKVEERKEIESEEEEEKRWIRGPQ